MADTGKDGPLTTVSEIRQRSSGSSNEKAGGALTGLTAQLGNEGMMERLNAGNDSRDDLLDFIVRRLGTMRDIQLAEIDLATADSNSLRTTLGESESQHDKPDPQRWIPAARLYKNAADALCTGQLHRGKALLDQAATEELRAVQSLSKFVRNEALEAEGHHADISSDVACTDRTPPDGLDVADDILQVTTTGNQDIKGQRRELDPWWTDLEEEEEEEQNAG